MDHAQFYRCYKQFHATADSYIHVGVGPCMDDADDDDDEMKHPLKHDRIYFVLI